jgi:hypothetical protein
MVIKAPDGVSCWINPPNGGTLEIQLRAPDGSVAGGGHNSSSAYKAASPRSTIAGGYDGDWIIEVSPREIAQTYPITYTLGCYAGNGMVRPVQLADGVDDF